MARIWSHKLLLRIGHRLQRHVGQCAGGDIRHRLSQARPAWPRLSPCGREIRNADKPSDQVAAEAAALDRLRTLWSGVYIANGDFDAARAADWIARGRTDAVSFGRPFIANPDLPERYRSGAALNAPDQATFYGGGAEGYTDYPSLDRKAA